MKKLAAILIVIALAVPVFAQQTGGQTGGSSFGVVIYAEGDVVSIIRDQRRFEYDAFTGELLGLAIYPGDIIQTDPNTYVEIQLLPSRSVIKVAENTSFTVEQVSSGGEGVFDLSYGRLRARVGRLTGSSPFEIRGPTSTAGVRGTDFGTDVVLAPTGGEAVTQIYCFEGQVEVEFHEPESAPAELPAPVVISANEMVRSVTLLPTASRAAMQAAPAEDTSEGAATIVVQVAEVETIEPEVQQFWERADFVAQVREPEEVLSEFPFLAEDALDRLGEVEFLGPQPRSESAAPESPSVATAEPEPEPEPEPEDAGTEVSESLQAAEAISLEADEEAVDPERQRWLINATRKAGIGMVALGALADAAAVTFYFFGDQLLPEWPPATDPQIQLAVGAGGSVFLIGGVLSLLFSIQLSR